ncbi:hypothetical protein [Arthrobacter sp. ISL-5]|uniref:hypothetical protein n=1 Tax=Arthrobacter sp. ISL-5 TaxID=2819111 RepID=UPI001BEBA4AC|nr:hypothetical protein [Arthrobacter sp. ISL-5]MBT2554333.1 hypothetical protein [Arthrobacter sp. ISL-5]
MTRRRKLRGAIVVVLSLVLVAGGIYTATVLLQRSEQLVTEGCTAVVGTQRAELATDQAANAALITAVSVRRGLPPRAASIALATAMQESKLRNIGHGDLAGPDSRGLFQQRPSQGWGTQEQVMDPNHATNAFYDALVEVPGYVTLEITEAAQRVQRSAYPRAYAQHEAMGRSFASVLSGQTHGALDCTLRAPDAAGDPGALLAEAESAYGGIPATASGRTLELEAADNLAWSLAHWAVANAKEFAVTRVQVDGQSWDRQARNGWQNSDASDGKVVITFAEAPA